MTRNNSAISATELGETRTAGVDGGEIGQPDGVARVTAAPPTVNTSLFLREWWSIGEGEKAAVISEGPLVPVCATNRD